MRSPGRTPPATVGELVVLVVLAGLVGAAPVHSRLHNRRSRAGLRCAVLYNAMPACLPTHQPWSTGLEYSGTRARAQGLLCAWRWRGEEAHHAAASVAKRTEMLARPMASCAHAVDQRGDVLQEYCRVEASDRRQSGHPPQRVVQLPCGPTQLTGPAQPTCSCLAHSRGLKQ